MRCACIDIGSNTTRLLVAESSGAELREVLSERAFTRLRSDGDAIAPAKIAEIAGAVAAQVELARGAGATSVTAVATAAIRQSASRDELCAAVLAASGLTVRVLSGEEEARLAFVGATRTLREAPDGVVAVVDVGGGSTEIVCGTAAGGVGWSTSFGVGSGILADAHLRGDPPTGRELELVRRHVAEIFDRVELPRATVAYAVGGSATSLRRLIGPVLDHDTLGRAVRVLSQAPAAEVARRFELHLERVRVLPAGLLLLDGASGALGLPLTIAAGGLREGVILERQAEVAA